MLQMILDWLNGSQRGFDSASLAEGCPVGGSVPRAPFQVLVIPFRIKGERVEYAIFKRADNGAWQGIAGGGEDAETPVETARREALEEAGLPPECSLWELDTTSSIPVVAFAENATWGDAVYVITEHCFGIDARGCDLRLSSEHREVVWIDYDEAARRLTFDGNKTALWELHQRVRGLGPREVAP
jgi:dATP pyrophosphohydrolase